MWSRGHEYALSAQHHRGAGRGVVGRSGQARQRAYALTAMRECPACGEAILEGFRFCGHCGAALDDAAPERAVRKTISVIFCDLKGSTILGETLDSEALREVITRYFGRVRGVIEGHGGAIEKFIGDAVMAVFGLPHQREDDARRAVLCALDMKRAL